MDGLKIALSIYMVIVVLNAAAAVAMIGRDRGKYTAGGAGCAVLISFMVFIMLMLTWQRL